MIALAGAADLIVWTVMGLMVAGFFVFCVRTGGMRPPETAREVLLRDGADMGKAKDL